MKTSRRSAKHLLRLALPCWLGLATTLPSSAVSLWDNSATPDILSANDPAAIEVGVKFRASTNGSVTGFRFYKGPANPGIHVGHLWTAGGQLLASATFAGETDAGWQQQALAAPVEITANTTYVVSVHAPLGGYSASLNYFASAGVDSPPLRALANGEDGGNAVYAYGPSGTFPDQTFNAANYWVDLVFEAATNNPCAGDVTPPVMTVPGNVILTCNDCDTAPARTGTATATDECGVNVTYADQVSGVCPKVVTRTWTAKDNAGNATNAVQLITCVPANLVTDSSGCVFDRDPATPAQDFRLLFIQDPRNWPCCRIPSSNPGGFLYNVIYTGTPGETVNLTLTLPYPFVTKGANPIHAYDWVWVGSDEGQPCLIAGEEFFVSAQQVVRPAAPAPSELPIRLTVPASGVVYLTVHLEYGFKGVTGYNRNVRDDAVQCGTGVLLIPNHGSYTFAVTGEQSASATIQNINVFKRIPGVAGLVSAAATADPVPGATVTLSGPTGVKLGTATTDLDGFYMLPYKYTGRAATHYLSLALPPPATYKEKKAVVLKANSFVQVDFIVP